MRTLKGKAAVTAVRKLAARGLQFEELEPAVARILREVRRRGDPALRRYARRWDGLGARESFRIDADDLRDAWEAADPTLKASLATAAANIREFCESQKPFGWQRSRNGITLGQIVRPVDRVGCYVPSGRYPLVSTLLMTAIPAQVAGVKSICVVSPRPRPEMLAAASMLGISEIYRIGGAQAIAALAYGTETIPRVDKIVGPGNTYVTVAKKLVAFDCGIDFLAGPTEVIIVSHNGAAEFIAADLVAQAEHDPDALAVFVTTRPSLAVAVARETKRLARTNKIAADSLRRRGLVLVAGSRAQALEWANEIAPEHITVAESDVEKVRNAGSIFVGDYSPQSVGDYAAGPNHVLPTGGAARLRGGLNVLDFVKLISVQKLTRPALRRIAPVVESLARTEGLTAHAESVRARCNHA
ncbi:MAG: histidinol dehydrogenase [Acidobacteriaceae bacterium]|nr:histidinol dehydrogenase [Acidobacteriaceae bacterium]